MIIVLSPAKTLDFESEPITDKATQPLFPDRASELVDILAAKSPRDLGSLMSISDQLAELNFERYQEWEPVFDKENSRAAILAFKGDVYQGLDVSRFGPRDFNYAQNHLRILSGLYGILRPLDVIQPYRLEMGSKLQNPEGKDLYDFWGTTITQTLNEDLAHARPKALINLASKEYFSAIQPEKLDGRIVTPVFRDHKNGEYKVISFYAKRARGLMASWILRNRIDTLTGLESFAEDGYRFSPDDSTRDEPVYLRG